MCLCDNISVVPSHNDRLGENLKPQLVHYDVSYSSLHL